MRFSTHIILVALIGCLNSIYSQTTLAKEDIAIIGVNTDNEDFTFLLRVDITAGTEIYFTDNEVNASGTGLNDTNEGIVLFTANTNYSCGSVLGYINNNSEFTNFFGSFALGNGGDEVLAFQGYNSGSATWTTFLHANVENTITLPTGFLVTDIVDGLADNREYNGSTSNPSWADLNTISNYNEGGNFSSITLSTLTFSCAICTPTHSITSFTPTSGPIGSYITITGTGFTASSTVTINGTTATIVSQTATTLEVQAQSGSTTGVITITEAGCPLDSSGNFTIIETSGTCTNTNITDVLITEVYDKNGLNNWYMELYNPTNSDIDLDALGTDYAIERYANIGGATPSRTIDLTGTITANSTFTLNLGDSADDCSFTADLDESGDGINANDEIVLLKNGVNVDVVEAPNEIGYSILRLSTATGPSATFVASDWSINSTESCADIGTFNPGIPDIPSIDSQPNLTTSCSEYTLNIMASTGGSGTITYQWKFNDGSTTNWLDVTSVNLSPATVSGETTNTLVISGIDLSNVQFYCEVTEDAVCSVASNAIKVTASSAVATWDGTNWNWNDGTAQDTMPNIGTSVILDADYDTSTGGIETSFSACSLIVNSGHLLNIQNGTYIEIETDITANGDITVYPQGAVVQIEDSGLVNGSGTMQVIKETAPMSSALEYTYWSSPVANTTIADALTNANVNRRYLFNAQLYLDEYFEVNNDNTQSPGQDDVDDDGNDWTAVTGTDPMEVGVGYASTHDPTDFSVAGTPPHQFSYTFTGTFNNGIYNVPLYRNDSYTLDTNWNFIGNPYPSAVDASLFFARNSLAENANGATEGVIYFWSHGTPFSITENGNEISNTNQGDYATLNSMGGTASSNGSPIPNGFIPSGQGFFVSMSNAALSSNVSGDIETADVVFNNSMRTTGNNTQFFRNTEPNNKLWLNLTSDIGNFSQILVGYVNNATSSFDGKHIDAPRNLSTNVNTSLYSIIEASDERLVIQGRNSSDLNNNEIIPLGIKITIDAPIIYTFSIAQFEGQFFTDSDIYIKDKLLNTIHNLKQSDYNFTSQAGEFNDRYEIVFNDALLSIDEQLIQTNQLTIIELQNNNVEFRVNSQFNIEAVDIFDLLGRHIYALKGNSSVEIYNLDKLSSSTYIAKVQLSNGQQITKKAIKR